MRYSIYLLLGFLFGCGDKGENWVYVGETETKSVYLDVNSRVARGDLLTVNTKRGAEMRSVSFDCKNKRVFDGEIEVDATSHPVATKALEIACK